MLPKVSRPSSRLASNDAKCEFFPSSCGLRAFANVLFAVVGLPSFDTGWLCVRIGAGAGEGEGLNEGSGGTGEGCGLSANGLLEPNPVG